MSDTHPNHLAKLEARRHERAVFDARLRRVNAYKTSFKFFHIRPDDHRRGLTIAYREVKKNLIELAVATVHPNDTFCKQMGRIVATEHMLNDRTITIRNSIGWNTPYFLKHTFDAASRKPLK